MQLLGWLSPGVTSAALLALAAGFGQFGAVAALGDVAKTFGHLTGGASVTEQAGLSGTELGLGLTIIRLASLGALPVAGIADRFGRRPTLLASCAAGLALTVAAAASPGYWWFVAIFALGRPFLSATASRYPLTYPGIVGELFPFFDASFRRDPRMRITLSAACCRRTSAAACAIRSVVT